MRKKSTVLKVVIPLLLVSALLLLPACAGPKAPEGAMIRVGVIADVTGPQSTSTGPIFEAMTDYWEYVNEELGGIEGIPVEVTWADSKSDSAAAVTHCETFIEQGVVLINNGGTLDVMGAKSILERAQIPVVGNAGTTALLVPPGWIYTSLPETGQTVATLLDTYYNEVWKKKGLDRPMKVAVVSWDNPWGRTGTVGVTRWIELQPPGTAELVFEAYTPMAQVDYTPELLRVKELGGDVISSTLTASAHGIILRDCGKVGLPEDVASLQYQSVFISGPREIAGDEIKRAYAANFYALPSETYDGPKIVNKLAQTKRGMEEFSSSYYLGCVNSMLAYEAIKSALDEGGYEGLDGAGVKAQLDQMCNVDFGWGPKIDFCGGSRVGPNTFRVTKWDSAKNIEVPITGWVTAIPLGEIYPEG